MKKGFTLVELIAVVVILGIILVIAVPRITDVIESAKINSVIKNEEMLVRATRNYLVSKDEKLPTEIGDTEEITLEELQNNDLISSIKSPFGNNNCNGYVLITKINDTNFDYTPHLNCVDYSIGSSEADKLVLHYKFDDFQEPTQNEIANMGYVFWLNNLEIGQSTDMNATREGQLTTTRFTRLGEHKFRAEIIEGGYYFIYPITNGGYNWNNGGFISANVLEYYEAPGSNGRIGIGRSSSGTPSLHGNGELGFKTAQIGALSNQTHGLSIRTSNHTVTPGSYIVWENLQLENKPYSTPFVDGTREGIITDYSANNNYATLDISDSPRWINNSIVGKGAYEFNTNTRILLPLTMNNTNFGLPDAQYTFSLWIYLNKHNNSGTGLILGMASYSGFGVRIDSDGSTFTRLSTYFRNSVGQYGTNNISLSLNKWYHIVSVLDKNNNNIKFYSNGELIHERAITINDFTRENFPFGINLLSQTGGNGPWTNIEGIMDDVRIYNRVLSNQEIKNLYQIAK